VTLPSQCISEECRAVGVRPVSMTPEEESRPVPPGICLAAYRCDRCGVRWIHASSTGKPRKPPVAIREADTDRRPDDRTLAVSIARAGLGR
jgi:hypothetical protein